MSRARCSRCVVSFEPMEARRLFATDFVSDAAGFAATETVNVNGTNLILADDGITGRELWKSDGTAAGTVFVKDLNSGAAGSFIVEFLKAGDRAVFVTQTREGLEIDTYTVWSSDGTAAGTVNLGEFQSSYLRARQVGDRVAFFVSQQSAFGDGLDDTDLYFTDGTVAGTTLVKRFIASPSTANDPGGDYDIDSFHVAGNRIVFGIGSTWIWASDGTAAGTFDLTPIVAANGRSVFAISLLHMEEFDGKVLIPTSEKKLWVTDGTAAGTSSRAFDVPHVEVSRIIGRTYFFQSGGAPGKMLFAMDLDSGLITNLYAVSGGGFGKVVRLDGLAGKLLMTVNDTAAGDFELWSSDGTVAGTVKVATLNRPGAYVPMSVTVADRVYLLVSTREPGAPDDPGEADGFIGAIDGGTRDIRRGELELWATDGKVEGSGFIRTIWGGDAVGKEVRAGIYEAQGKLVIRTRIITGPWDDKTVLWDDTLVYDPEELSSARGGAIAKLVNGVLRLHGSMGPDNFHVYRLSDDPSKLVVEYNGNKRVFTLNTIRRIVADLQDGNDTLDIDESVGGEIRLWTSILGGDGADTILTGVGRDTIIGGSGGDTIRSRGNADAIIGGGGRDRITSGQGDDIIVGGTGHDSMIAGTGHDVLFGQNAIEQVFGSLWDDGDTLEDLVLQSL